MYSAEVLDHFQSPRNVGEYTEPDAVGEAGNPVNGNSMKLYLHIDGERITDARFRTFGCAASIAASSKLTELIIGQTIEEADEIRNDTVARALGGLPATKMHCSAMAADGVHAALSDYKRRLEETLP